MLFLNEKTQLSITNYQLPITNYQLPMPHAPCPMPYSQFPTFLWQQYVKMLNPVLYVFPKRTI
ncbi:MAG: hypothetical protein WBF90_37395, partial [Rivularia sp. (in: cyanobacteria)]